ncbi:MAG: UDP-N-acetylmuramate dehydrogenase [Proteobacteria bacterium]|nr:UDP-N-acetylmuramate dehydrogenase [Pseudomonadota bacterium]
MRELLNEPLAVRTTLGLGGPARRVLELEHEHEVVGAVRALRRAATPWVVLGGGSNVLIADEGFAGCVLQPLLRGITRRDDGAESVEVWAAAGEPWSAFVAACVAEGLGGLECLAGIPGWVGATPIQNVGAYGQQVSDCLTRVRVYDAVADRLEELPASACGLSYRRSVFKQAARERYVILGAGFRLSRRPAPLPAHPELRALIAASSATAASAQRIHDAVLTLRRSKGMVLDAQDPETRSAGSFFLNPQLAAEEAEALLRRAARDGGGGEASTLPYQRLADGTIKLAAAWLIEQAGFGKGFGDASVGISRKHALAVVHRGGGSARAVLALATEIRRGVHARFGVWLEPEPMLIGFGDDPLPR